MGDGGVGLAVAMVNHPFPSARLRHLSEVDNVLRLLCLSSSAPPLPLPSFLPFDGRTGRVGKTSLILRYVRQIFAENQQATIQVRQPLPPPFHPAPADLGSLHSVARAQASFLTKKLTLGNSRVQLAIWDTAGQERFHALGPIYYRDADGKTSRVQRECSLSLSLSLSLCFSWES